jgi:phage protein U
MESPDETTNGIGQFHLRPVAQLCVPPVAAQVRWRLERNPDPYQQTESSQTGQKPETLTITGKSMYAVAMDRLDELRALQALRIPLPLIDGIGRNWGLWRINNVQENPDPDHR